MPEELAGTLAVGMEVIVPFGRNDREISGYIVGFSEDAGYDPKKIKPVLGKAEGKKAIESRLVALAAWMKENYGGTMIQALKTVLPVKKQEKTRARRTVKLLLTREAAGRSWNSISIRISGPGPGFWRGFWTSRSSPMNWSPGSCM